MKNAGRNKCYFHCKILIAAVVVVKNHSNGNKEL